MDLCFSLLVLTMVASVTFSAIVPGSSSIKLTRDSPGMHSAFNPFTPLTNEIALDQQVLVLVPEDRLSSATTKPFKQPVKSIDFLRHVQNRLSWEAPNGKFNASLGELSMCVQSIESFSQDLNTYSQVCNQASSNTSILLMIGLEQHHESIIETFLKSLPSSKFNAIVAFDSTPALEAMQKFGNYLTTSVGVCSSSNSADVMEIMKFTARDYVDQLFKTTRYEGRETYKFVLSLWKRQTVEDTLFLVLVLIDKYAPNLEVKGVQAATSSDNTGLHELKCMCSNCGKEMVNCFKNPTCRKALDCLNKCKQNDQVCAYKCITSYETQDFEKFAQCILQKNNCMNNFAEIPMTPDPPPLHAFRGKELTHEVAEDLLIGHLRPRENSDNHLVREGEDKGSLEPWSWKVIAGVNPSYDYFSDQHQIFYRDAKRPKIMWYDPVFKVITLDGQEVWRKRHYRVRRGNKPGRFRLTVLDNGVLSDEYWRILDVADDLSWGILYYSGAASAAGTSYQGALIVSKDGRWPSHLTLDSPDYQRITRAFKSVGIEMYEIYEVSQSEVNLTPPPLDIV